MSNIKSFKMPAPLVIPMAENMTSFTAFAEKANQVSENKWKLEVSKLETQQNEKLSKMTKEMNKLKYQLSQVKPKREPLNKKRLVLKELERSSPVSNIKRHNSVESSEDSDSDSACSTETKKNINSRKSKAERNEHERISNLHRRYSCQLGSGESKVTKTVNKSGR